MTARARALICPECGLVELPEPETLCPTCGLTALDDTDPANKDALHEAISLRRQLSQPRWGLATGALVFGVALLAGIAITDDFYVGELAGYICLIASMLVTSALAKRSLSPAWHAAIEHVDRASGQRALARRIRNSVTVWTAAVLVAFVGIQLEVGTEQLAYARGDAPWRLLTSALCHGGPMHLIGNLVALLVFGIAIDLRVGRVATLAILVAAALGGALAQAAYAPTPMIGFSGAICGLAGATLALLPNRPTVLAFQGIAIPMPTWLWSFFWLGLLTLLAWAETSANVAWVCHLGGFATGFLVGIPMRRLPPSPCFELFEERRRERVERLATR